MADYISQFTGSEIDQRLAKVPQLESGKQDKLVSGTNIKTINGQSVLGSGDMTVGDTDAVKYVAQTLTDAQKAQARTNIAAASAAELGQIVTDLTGIEADIDSLEAAVQAIGVGDFVTATTLPTASASTMGHIYLIGPDANNNYDRYFTQESGGAYSWVSLGSTQIDLSTYATEAELSQLQQEVTADISQLEADLDGIIEKTAHQSKNLYTLTDADLGKELTSGASEMTLSNYKTYEASNSQINTLAPIQVPAGKYIVISYTNSSDPNTARQTGTFKNFIRFDNNGDFLSRNFSQGTWKNETGELVTVVVGVYNESVPGSYYGYAMIEVNDDGVPSSTYEAPGTRYTYDLDDNIPTKQKADSVYNEVSAADAELGTTITDVDLSDSDNGYYLNKNTGQKLSYSGYSVSHPIFLASGCKVIAHLAGQDICLLAETNALGTAYSVIQSVNTQSGYTDVEYTANEDMYVALCWKNDAGNYAKVSVKSSLSTMAKSVKETRSDVDKLLEGGVVADYFTEEIASVSEDIYEAATNPCLIFNVITDTHQDKENEESVRRTKESIENISALNGLVRSDGVVHLGDTLSVSMNTETNDEIYRAIGEYITSLFKAGVQVFPVIGNHDGPSVNGFNPNRWDAVAGRLADDYTKHPSPLVNGNSVKYWPAYYYRDFPQMNVRCIFLSMPESDEQYTYGLSPNQLKWFAEVALNVEAGTQIIIFAHMAPFDTDMSSKTTQYEALVGICDAFANKTTYTKTGSGWNINADFSSTTGAKICGYFCGHQHFDNVANPGWTYEGLSNQGEAHTYENEFSFPVVNIGAGLMTNSGSNTFGGTAPSRTDKTATQDLWDTIVYRPDVSKFYLIRFGAGEDREITIPE